MPTSRLGAGAICMGGSIYVIGGEKNGKRYMKFNYDANGNMNHLLRKVPCLILK